ncbi:MAG: CopG family transcriptional regulator [Sulfolobus sp.]|nr:CopG family transcriptional regulator [Sulfolobus sp.]
MKSIIIKLDDEEYKKLEKEASQQGFVLLSDYIRYKLLNKQSTPQTQQNVQQFNDEIINQITIKLERKIQDMINPFTGEIEELKKKIAEIFERLDSLEDVIQKEGSQKSSYSERKLARSKEKSQKTEKKTGIEILREKGVLFESELNLKNPDAFFDKLESQGAKIITTETERIAIDDNFYNDFLKKLEGIHTQDEAEVQKSLNKTEYKLFQKLRKSALLYFDNSSKSWKFITS